MGRGGLRAERSGAERSSAAEESAGGRTIGVIDPTCGPGGPGAWSSFLFSRACADPTARARRTPSKATVRNDVAKVFIALGYGSSSVRGGVERSRSMSVLVCRARIASALARHSHSSKPRAMRYGRPPWPYARVFLELPPRNSASGAKFHISISHFNFTIFICQKTSGPGS